MSTTPDLSRNGKTLADHAQSPLAKAKRRHTRAVKHLKHVQHDNEAHVREAQAKVDAAREVLREAARIAAATAPDLTPEKRARLRTLLDES
jgi:hypothetical protein